MSDGTEDLEKQFVELRAARTGKSVEETKADEVVIDTKTDGDDKPVDSKIEDGKELSAPKVVEAETAPTDPFAAAPAELKAKWEEAQKRIKEREDALSKLQNEHRALQGRLTPFQRKVQDLENQLRTQKAPEPTKPATPDSYKDSEDWQQFKRDFPEDAKRIETALEAERKRNLEEARSLVKQELEQALKPLNESVLPRLSKVEELERKAELSTLESKHPQWQEHFAFVPDEDGKIVGTKTSPKFDAWFDSKNRFEKQAILDAVWSNSAADLIELWDWFDNDHKPQISPSNVAAAKVAEDRRQRLETNVQPAIKAESSPVRLDLDQMSDEDKFAYLRSQRKKRA